jgi:nucleotide sugar dehydrogenase
VTLCVHGLGYVGLSTAALFATTGYDVVGYDTDESVVTQLQTGEFELSEPDLESFVREALAGQLSVSAAIPAAETHLICVPTPYNNGADLRYVEQAATGISETLRPGDTVVVESTVPPTTTATTVTDRLEQSGLSAGEDFHLAYAPETVMPGNTVAELRENDRIVGGIDDASAYAVKHLYATAVAGDIHIAPDATTAEFVKLSQNASRDVAIAFANELALLADDYDVDVRTAIDLANTHPRVEILDPGPGVGGHCLPVDPLFLAAESDSTALVDCARAVNDGMTDYIVEILQDELGDIHDSDIAILGVAYKGNVDETRNSPGLALAQQLEGLSEAVAPIADGGSTDEIRLTDPHVTDESLNLVSLTEALRGADAAVITAAHDEYATLDPERVASLQTGLLLDTVDVLDAQDWRDHDVTQLGI